MNGSMKPWLEWGRIGPDLKPELGPEWNIMDRKLLGAHSIPPRPILECFGQFRPEQNGIDDYGSNPEYE